MTQYSELYDAAQAPFTEAERMGGRAAETMERELGSFSKVEEVPAKRRWRDLRLAELAKLKVALHQMK